MVLKKSIDVFYLLLLREMDKKDQAGRIE